MPKRTAEQRADRRRHSQERLAEIERLKRIHGSEPFGLPMNAERWDWFIDVAKEIELKKQERKAKQWEAAQHSLYSPRDFRMLAHLMQLAVEYPEQRLDALTTAVKVFDALAKRQSS